MWIMDHEQLQLTMPSRTTNFPVILRSYSLIQLQKGKEHKRLSFFY